MIKDRLLWIDWLKFLAIFGVIGIHVTSPLINPQYFASSQWFQGVYLGSLFRFGIILFVMASGYLILRRQQSIYEIPKRAKRILLPFIFWLLVYAFIKVVIINDLGPSWNLYDLIAYIFRGFLDPTIISVQFWYVYMIFGLYLLSPILSRWIQNAPIKEIEYFLMIWVCICIIQFSNVNTILVDYLRYFTGAIGYFILGYYLTIKEKDLLKDRSFGLMMFLLGSVITILGTITVSLMMQNHSYFFIRLGDITPGACLQGVGLFIIIFNTNFNRLKEKINNIAVRFSAASYGIYLVNVLIVNILEKIHLFDLKAFPIIGILILITLTLLIGLVIVEIMDKIPILKYFSGKG